MTNAIAALVTGHSIVATILPRCCGENATITMLSIHPDNH